MVARAGKTKWTCCSKQSESESDSIEQRVNLWLLSFASGI